MESEENTMITDEKTMIIETMTQINNETDKFYNETLPEMLSVNDGLITLSHWFAARKIIKESGIYERNYSFMEYARAHGYDIKIDMQTYKLSYHGMIGFSCNCIR